MPSTARTSRSKTASKSKKSKSPGRCWKGYEPTPGKKPYSPGSCRKR